MLSSIIHGHNIPVKQVETALVISNHLEFIIALTGQAFFFYLLDMSVKIALP